VLLLHANALLADQIERVIAMLRTEGFRFVTLEHALEDPIYGQEDHWVDPVGSSWLYRTEPVDLEGWSWDRGQQRAMEARFGLRPDESTRIGRNLSTQPLDGVPAWIVTHEEPISANSLVLVADDGSPILADTPWTPAATRELLDWVVLRFGRLPVLATVSHYHLDAAGGIGPLLEAGVRVVASTDTARLLAERGPSMQSTLAEQHGSDFTGWSAPQPNETFRPGDGHSVRIGGTAVQVIFPGAAHSPDNVVTWFPETRILFGGCMVKGGDSLGYLGDADLETYPAAVQALRELSPRIVVPGHGDRTDVAQLDNTLRLVELERRDDDVPPSATE
jgi:glyoxylase-like metal-dependent hydrolase (beta-lactamase superfamily II)